MSERNVATTIEPGTYFVDKYLIRGKLGGGGMGQVFEAVQEPIDRTVAIKVLHPKFVADREVQQRFLQEAQAASQLSHPNTITIYDFGRTEEDLYFIAMEYLEGQSLAGRLEDDGALPLKEAVPLVIQVAQSLGEAHRKGIIHRDLKPDNIMVLPANNGPARVKVLDFGIAKLIDNSADLTQTGTVFGTPGYMAPEQARGKQVDPSADFYALSCCLYELLTGELPYQGDSAVEVMMQHQEGEVPTLDDSFPPSLNLFLRRSLSEDPDSRPQSADDYIAGLLGCFVDDPTDGYSPQPGGLASSDELFASENTGANPSRLDSEVRSGRMSGVSPEQSPGGDDERGIHDEFRTFVEEIDATDDAPDSATGESDRSNAADDGPADANPAVSDAESGPDEGPAAPDEPSEPAAPSQTASQVQSSGDADSGTDAAGAGIETRSLDPKTVVPAVALLLAAGIGIGTYVRGSADGETVTAASAGDEDLVSLTVASQPDGAIVTLDSSRVGVTPIDLRIPRDEPFSVKVEKEGYETVREEGVRPTSFSQNRFFADLAKKTVELEVTAPVARAALTIDGDDYGRLPADQSRSFQVDWPDSTLTVEIDAPGYEPYVTKVPPPALDETLRIAPARSDLARKAGDETPDGL